MVNIVGYQLCKQLYNGSRTLVYGAIRDSDQKPVVIKLLKNPYPNFNELLQFRNQYTISKNLDIPGIIRPYSLEAYQNSYALVMEDIKGISLCEYMQVSDVSLWEILSIAVQISDILYNLHQNRVIHKDIKPDNILINPETKQVKLIDFSIASLLPKETQEIKNPNSLEGTLAYISPEQTGRMNRGIDYRSDFYSLGVTLFELITGELPFQSDDPMELVHCHITHIPPRMKKPHPNSSLTKEREELEEIPEVIEDIVLKLMAKNAEDRYQSGLGLKHDLETCLTQLKETGNIEKFEIGKRDKSDRFIIPQKLYGREKEVEQLLAAFERVSKGNSTLMLVAGFSGIGKTAVVNEVHKPIVKQRGYFIKGKFDQFNRNIPFSAFVEALRNLIAQLLSESDAQLSTWKNKILQALGDSGQVIIDVIPELEQIISQQPPVAELSGAAAQNRFNLLFQKFIQVFTTKEHPLVIFLDDLQWADSASLNLIKLLMSEAESSYLLMIGAYRDNEVFPAHPLMLTLDEINKAQAKINTITLTPLSHKNINYLVADTFSCDEKIAQPLTDLLYQKTKGNPFFTTQFLMGLYGQGLINFNFEIGYWECDITEVRQQTLTDDVVEFMAQRLQKLPIETQEILKLAACIGNQFDLKTLAIVSEKSEVDGAHTLWKALQEGLILPQSQIYKFFQGEKNPAATEQITVLYKFLHDRVQQAAYSLIPDAQKQSTHLHIGQLLLHNLSWEEQQTHIFTIVNHWNQAIELIADNLERDKLILLNLTAGQKAKASQAIEAALQYFQTALSLLDSESWKSNYSLTLKLHEQTAEAAYLTGNFELMETNINQVLNHSQNLLDCIKVHEIKIASQMAQTKQLSALNIGIEFLGLLGIQVPQSPQTEDLQVEIAAITQAMEGKTIAELADLPLMEDKKQLAKVNILANLFSPCYQANPSLFPWVVCKLMQLLIQYGNTAKSAHIYSCYGMVCIFALHDYNTAAEYGKLACQLDLDPQTGDGVSGNYVAGGYIIHCSNHLHQTLPLLLKSYQNGLETGNFEYGGYAIVKRSHYLYLTGYDLLSLKEEMTATIHALANLKQGHTLTWSKIFQQNVLNLLGDAQTPWELVGTAYNETTTLPLQLAANDRTGLHYIYQNKLILCYLFDRIPQAVENAPLAQSYLDGVVCMADEYIYNFYDSLTQLARYSHEPVSIKTSIREKVEANQLTMQDWARHAPMNGQHKYDLVSAEYNRILGNKTEAIELYEKAIEGAKANEYIQEQALANELAAKFFLEWGKEKAAMGYMQQAYYCYAKWGAKAKTNDLENRYPQLLCPILEQEQINPFTSLKSTLSQSISNTSTCNLLDLGTVIKTSQAISLEIHLNKLLSTLMSMVIENAGADKGVFLSPAKGEIIIEAVIIAQSQGERPNISVMSSPVLQSSVQIPSSLVHYVSRTRENLVINNLDADSLFAGDEYFNHNQPQSILCTPILHQGKLTGILYLENNLTKEAFTTERLELLNLICSQAAISLENARLYENLEQKVQERTKELSQTLEELKTTQNKLVESEKMAALGSLVAGVAHEINTPVGTSITVASNLAAKTEDFADNISQGKLKRSILNNYVEIAQQSSDLLLHNLKRAGELVNSFKQVAVDQSNLELRKFAVKEYIEGVVLSLDPQIKTSPHKIKVSGDDNLTINNYAGSLAQVVTNLVMNSLIHAYPQGEAGQLNFEIISEAENIKIIYSDDGCGIPQENLGKIFEPFFTTKRNKGGTGLGLHIVYNLINHKLQGSIDIESQVGQGTKCTLTIPSGIV